jgi:hypothetical protein
MDPGPEGILAKVRTGAPVKWCSCSRNTHNRLQALRAGAVHDKGPRQTRMARGPPDGGTAIVQNGYILLNIPRDERPGTLTGYRRAPGPERW